MIIVIIIFVPIKVLYDSHMCVLLFILQRTSISKRYINKACSINTKLGRACTTSYLTVRCHVWLQVKNSGDGHPECYLKNRSLLMHSCDSL